MALTKANNHLRRELKISEEIESVEKQISTAKATGSLKSNYEVRLLENNLDLLVGKLKFAKSQYSAAHKIYLSHRSKNDGINGNDSN